MTPVIGKVTTREIVITREGTTLTMPASTYNVIQVIEKFGDTGQPAYITDVTRDGREHLVITRHPEE